MELLFVLVAFVGLIAGPIVVAKFWPYRGRVTGDAIAGECGSSPIFWGVPLGLSLFVGAIAASILAGPESMGNLATKVQIAAVLLGILALLCAPFVVCGFHTWRWNSSGLEFAGLFRRQSILWNDISEVRRYKRMGWTLRTNAGSKLSMSSGYVPGEPLIIAALMRNRPDLTPIISLALEEER